jgi:hypothetical protein
MPSARQKLTIAKNMWAMPLLKMPNSPHFLIKMPELTIIMM